ncbi:hamartin isoform X1 [Drosophila persimilis]|uniref:hamartin isoform X1 n=1 Tax=Drosophila persimilis TaxID=7234 RepID=UPI000F081F0E|nr:hamartin isoform X1 [Drosophila persimilis]
MDFEKIFHDLESNQTLENEEAKKKLVELFTQNKETWAVNFMLDYFFKTGSQRILDVLVKAQKPHDSYIFDRLDACLNKPQHRVQGLQVFCFIVRHHPTWLYKIESHRLIKTVFNLLTHEKEIVPLMSALLCIITLLPIIPNSMPNFFNYLFEVFGHLASWKLQNSKSLPDEKLVHLQLGLQMLFHRLYGMYPNTFMAFLAEFIKKGNGGGVFQHTIKPLLNTVRVHPMLLTDTPETEVNNTRWKEMEPHDVVMECANLSLPVLQPESSNDDNSYAYPMTPGYSRMTSNTSNTEGFPFQLGRDFHYSRNSITRFDSSASGEVGAIWSPQNEILATSSAIPLTPTTSFILPLQPSMNSQLLIGMTGSSPPEAAVEATPETTPLKDLRELKQPQHGLAMANSHAVRAIFPSSQPSSPMRKDLQNQFNFPDISREAEEGTTKFMETTRVTTAYERRLQQVMQDRHSLHAQLDQQRSLSSVLPEINLNSELTLGAGTAAGSPYHGPSQEVAALCGECNETDRNMCSDGGLHMPTSRSMHTMLQQRKRRNRMASYSGNETCSDGRSTAAKKASFSVEADNPIRRAKSCSALAGLLLQQQQEANDDEADCPAGGQRRENGTTQKTGSRLQRSGRILAMAMVAPKEQPPRSFTNATTQTLEGALPVQYENWMIELLFECKEQRNNYERSLLYPQDILEEYIKRGIRANESFDAEQCKLLCLQLEYESYRRSIHAERNRRLMGRSRDKRSLEMERDRLREQLKNFDAKNKDLASKMDNAMRLNNERQKSHQEELAEMKSKYQHELEEKKCLRQANDDLQTRLTSEMAQHKEMKYELESLRGQVFSLSTELQHAQLQADLGLQCKQELARLEAEFIIMGEVQVRCRDRLAEIDNYRARDEELQMLQESSHLEQKDLRHSLDEKTSQLESMKHRISDLQAQLTNSEKAMTEQKRLLSTVKDEYEEKFKAVNKKYDVQKKIIMQMEEKLIMMMQQPQGTVGHNTCSPDTDRTDIASSTERNSPLSTSLASSESLSASLRSTELKNLQQLVETNPSIPEVPSSAMYELASSASTANAINITSGATIVPHALELPSTSASSQQTTHPHPHLHLQQQQMEQQQQQHHQSMHSQDPQPQMRL